MKPLNIWSRSDEEIGRLVSNFAHTPFTLHGVEYASIEAFYVALLISSEEKRAKVRKMWGVRAKHECPKIKPESIEYRGETIALGSKNRTVAGTYCRGAILITPDCAIEKLNFNG